MAAAAKSMLRRAPKVRKSQEQGGTFRILVGSHYGPGPEGCTCENCEQILQVKSPDGTVKEVKGTNHRYDAWMNPELYPELGHPPDRDDYKGDIIVTSVDLVQRFAPGKFERLNELKLQRESALEEENAALKAQLAALQGKSEAPKEQPKEPVPLPKDALETMSEQQLKEYAATAGIDVKGQTGKGALLRAIRGAKH
jgi:hypothetical protein